MVKKGEGECDRSEARVLSCSYNRCDNSSFTNNHILGGTPLSLSLSRMASRTERTTRELIQTLPQELFALIYEEVFTATPASIFVLKHEVRHRRILFPTALHVDRASRASYARSFFAVTQFIFRRPEEIRSWLAVVDTLKTNSGVLVEHARGWVIESARDWVIEPARDWEFIC